MGLRRNGRSVRSCLLLTRRRRRSLGRFFRFRGGRGRWAERWAVDEWIPWSLHPHFVTSDPPLGSQASLHSIAGGRTLVCTTSPVCLITECLRRTRHGWLLTSTVYEHCTLTLYISLSIYEPNHGHGSELD